MYEKSLFSYRNIIPIQKTKDNSVIFGKESALEKHELMVSNRTTAKQ